jgi:hypothetical protein
MALSACNNLHDGLDPSGRGGFIRPRASAHGFAEAWG